MQDGECADRNVSETVVDVPVGGRQAKAGKSASEQRAQVRVEFFVDREQ